MKIQLDNRLDGGKRPTQPPSMFSGVPSCALRSHQKYQDQVRQSLPKHFQENKNETKISAIQPKTFKRDCQEVLIVYCLPGEREFVSFVDRLYWAKHYTFHSFQGNEIYSWNGLTKRD